MNDAELTALCPRRLLRGFTTSLVGVLVCATSLRAEAENGATQSDGNGTVGPVADLQAIQNAFEALAKRAAPSVVTIRSVRRVGGASSLSTRRPTPLHRGLPERRVSGAGSGVIVRSDGVILTNEHVVHEAEHVIVHVHDGRAFSSEIVQSDPRSDLAILKIEATGLRAADLGDVADLRQGHFVFAMGNPFGVASEVGRASMSWGLVSALGRPLPMLGAAEDRYYGNLIETTAAINPGNSGGPLFDIRGRVVGITTAISTRTGRSEGVGFAVPISRRTRQIIETLIKGERVEYGLLGVFVRTPSQDELARAGVPDRRGALINAVETGSPAHKAQLRPGDFIVKFDGNEVLDSDHLVRMAGSRPPGQTVQIAYYRNRKAHTVAVTLDYRPRRNGDGEARVQWRGLTVVPIKPNATRPAAPPNEDATPRDGLTITDVRANSPAGRAGMQPGTTLRRIAEESVTTPSEFRRAIDRLRGQPVRVTVDGGKQFTLMPN